MKLTAESTVFNDDKVQEKFAELVVDADGIRTEVSKKVGNTEIISRINQSAESVKIQANRVEIDGTAIFNAISDDVDDAITDKGYATTTQAQGYANDAKNEAIAEIPTDVSELNNDSGYQTASDVSGAIVSTTTLYYASNSTTAPNKPTAHVTTDSASKRNAWNIALPAYNASYPHLYVCTETKTKGGAYAWTSVEQTTYASAISAIKTTADGAAPKSSAIAEEQRIYYRSNSSTKPNGNGLPTTWVTETGDKYNTNATTSTGWSKKVTPIANGTGSSVTKYLYLWTCIQKKTVDGTVTYGDILLDGSTTVIDGGKIVTGSVSANAVSASSGTFNTANIPDLNANKITAGDIAAARMKVNSIAAINSLTTGKIDADRLNVEQITVGDLSDGSSYSTTEEMNTAIGDAVDNVTVGGRNLWAYGSDCQNSLDGLYNPSNGFSIVTEDGYKCAHASGALKTTKYLQSKLGYVAKPSETFTYSCYVKIKNIVRGTTNPMCEFYFSGQTIDGSWKGLDTYKVYLDGELQTGSYYFDRQISDTKWHHFAVVGTYANANFTATFLPNVYLRDCTGDLYVRNLKAERGNKATDWTPAPEDVQNEIDTKKSVHTLMTGNSSGNTYANILGFVAEGHSQQWTVNTATTPLTNVKIGDTCRIAYKVSDMNGAYVYPTGVVTNIGTNTVTMTMHGLDTTIIDGGNILTNSITANQIATNAITADELAANAVTANKIASNAVTSDKIAAGAITVGKINPIVYTYSNGGRGTGYAKLCTISVTENYRNKPIQFTLHSRNKNATAVSWRFLNSNSPSTCTVSSATYDGDTPLYYVGTGGTYTIYFALGESYDEVRIYDLIIPYDTGLTVAWAGEYYGTSLPSGAVAFTKLAGTRTSAELDNAAKTATTYITHIDNNGIRVHPSSTENNSVVINASGMEVFKGGTTSAYSVAKYGDTARIGKESGSHLTLSPDSMSMSTGTKDVFNLLQKTMYIYWTRNYKGRQFANSTDRHVDSWETNTTISTWDSIAVNYKLNNTSRTKKITSISNGVLANDEIYVHFNYSGTKITLTYGRGSSAASSDIIKLESAVVYYVTDEKLSQLHTGTYPNTTVSGALRIGNGTSDSNRINLMLVDWSGTGKFKGDILAFCGADSSGGMSLTKAEENIDAFKYEDANGHVYIDAYRVGRIVSLLCIVSKTASTAAGADLYRLDLTNAHLPKPLGTNTSGTGISSGNVIIGNIYYNKTVTPNKYEFVCRNGGSTAMSTGGVGFTITYICQMDEVSGEIKYMDD